MPVRNGKVEEDAPGLTVAGEIEEFAPGRTERGSFRLEAGSYVLICNIAGHYENGMRTAFRVT
ncbi:MAG: hypothetical protein C4344_05615 [Acidimicrobiia bacterium]